MVSSFGTRIGTVGTLSRALGPAKENIYALESLKGVHSVGLAAAKTEIPTVIRFPYIATLFTLVAMSAVSS